jgi:uncharacterized membrane protein (DUF485 family)
MNRNLLLTYKWTAAGRLFVIIAAFILSALFRDSQPKTGLFAGGIDLDFDWWVAVLVILMYCAFAAAVLYQLLVSFAPQFSDTILQRKSIVWIIFVIELMAAGLISYIAAGEIQQYFFPRPRTILDSLLSPLLPVNQSTLTIGKWLAVNTLLMALCSIYFTVFIWKFRKHYQPTADTIDADANKGL